MSTIKNSRPVGICYALRHVPRHGNFCLKNRYFSLRLVCVYYKKIPALREFVMCYIMSRDTGIFVSKTDIISLYPVCVHFQKFPRRGNF